MQLRPPWHHLVPYMAAVGASCIWFVPRPIPSVGSMALKCLPVVLLASYLFHVERWAHREADFVFVALVLSALGDAFLVFPKTLALPGIVAFGLAQLAFTYAFGFSSINWVLGAVLYGLVIVFLVVILIMIKIPERYRMIIPVPVFYAVLIMTMLWRALDRYRLKEDLSIERRLCTSLGGVIFVISDLSIIFLQGAQLIPQPYSKYVTMITYYLAQLLITLGTTETFWSGSSSGKVDEVFVTV